MRLPRTRPVFAATAPFMLWSRWACEGPTQRDAETLSGTLSQRTPFASPRKLEREAWGEAAPAEPRDATPRFMLPASPTLLPAPAREPLCWQDARPPREAPGASCSWLFVPLFHAAAGALTQAATHEWKCHPYIGVRSAELAGALRRAPAAQPSTILRFFLAELACVDRDPAHRAADVACAEALTALPAAPLLLAIAVVRCMDVQGYVPAAAQVALLQIYRGAAVASAAQTLAEDARRARSVPRTADVTISMAATQSHSARIAWPWPMPQRGGPWTTSTSLTSCATQPQRCKMRSGRRGRWSRSNG